MDARIFFWTARYAWRLYIVAFFAGCLSWALLFEFGLVGRCAEALLVLGIVLMVTPFTSQLAQLNLPVRRRAVARAIWFVAVVTLPFAYTIGQEYMVIGRPNRDQLVVEVKYSSLVWGVAAAFSLALAIYRRYSKNAEGSGIVATWAVRLLPFTMAFIPACALLSIMKSRRFPHPQLDLAVFASLGLLATSLIFAVQAWYPGPSKKRPGSHTRISAITADFTSLPTTRQLAYLRCFWARFVGLGLVSLVAALALHVLFSIALGEPLLATPYRNFGYIFINCTGMLTLIWIWVYMPSIRALRHLPLSRHRLNLFILSLSVAACSPALMFAAISIFLFGLSPLDVLALVLVLIGMVSFLTALAPAVTFTKLFPLSFVSVAILQIMGDMELVSSRSLLSSAAVLVLTAYMTGYYMIGHSARAYRRNSILADDVRPR